MLGQLFCGSLLQEQKWYQLNTDSTQHEFEVLTLPTGTNLGVGAECKGHRGVR